MSRYRAPLAFALAALSTGPAGPALAQDGTARRTVTGPVLVQAAPAAPAAVAQATPTPAGAEPAFPPAPAPASGQTLPAPLPPDGWPAAEVAAARARCTALLKGLDAVVVPEEPLKQGNCGTPAPVTLVSIGNHPQIAFSPPPTLTCDMVATLGAWLKEDVQPKARAHLGAPIARIDVMSSYSCRGAYGRAANRLSEHAHANALDIRGFVATNAVEVGVLADWGMTAREIALQVAAAKAEAEKLAAEKAAAEKAGVAAGARPPAPGQPLPAATPVSPAPPAAVAGPGLPGLGTIIEGVPQVWRLPGPRPGDGNSGYGLSAPSRLGGPKARTAEALPPNPVEVADRKSRFLREIHAAACRKFGTILGPESNSAHKNHFHLDMAQRKNGNFCE